MRISYASWVEGSLANGLPITNRCDRRSSNDLLYGNERLRDSVSKLSAFAIQYLPVSAHRNASNDSAFSCELIASSAIRSYT
jgi:hypothetical protein